jgi:hypothetical protein
MSTSINGLLRAVCTRYPDLRALLHAAKRLFYVALFGRHAELKAPFTYKSLVVEEARLRYADLTGQEFVVDFDDIQKVEFVREEALFEDPLYGPYLETRWLIHVRDRFAEEIMDEEVHRSMLLGAFLRALPHFQETAVVAALASNEEGRWVCFSRRSGALVSPP